MKSNTNGHDDAFNELSVLLQRNESGESHPADVELDMRRLLLMTRDTWLRDQLVQVQGVRKVTLISKATPHVATQRICAGILGNIARSELGRLSASSCDRWHCVSHRHHCPLSMLLANAQCKSDHDLMRISGAALLAFSVQNQCQRHIDNIGGLPVLLKLLDVKQEDGDATEVAVYAAAMLWNMCKAPALLLKLETIYGILKDQLTRKLTNLLVTPLEPFDLFRTPTGERGMPESLDFDSENLNLMVSASITTQLTVVLSVENYVGHARSLADQFRSKTPPAGAVSGKSRAQGASQTGKSTAHYDESGMLASRTCAACAKNIRLSRKASKRKQAQPPTLLCSKEGCGQMYHLSCSRWRVLSEEIIAGIMAESGRLDANFYCDGCVSKTPPCYWDFLAAHAQHEFLLTGNLFKSVIVSRVVPTTSMTQAASDKRSSSESTRTETSESTSSQHDREVSSHPQDEKAVAVDDQDGSPWPSIMLFDRNFNLLGVGDKFFRISASSRDPEMYVVTVKYILTRSYPATRQERAIPKKGDGDSSSVAALLTKWEASYARQGAIDIPIAPGNAVFWPAQFTRDILAFEYTRRSLDELENAFLYEFQGEQPHDKTFSIGSAQTQSALMPAPLPSNSDNRLWMDLAPRKGICMKLLAAQLGHVKKLNEVHNLQSKKPNKPSSTKGVRKPRKPHFPGKQLNKVAVDATS